MKHLSLKLAVLSTLGMLSAQATAGFVYLPAAGFSVSGGTSAYTIFNPSGNFGSGTDTSPTIAGFDRGHAIPASAANAPAPYGTLTLVGAATGNVVVNNTYTNNTNVTVATWNNRLWRNATGTSCVYGYNVVNMNPASADYRPLVTGTQFIEFNDIAYGGFSGLQVGAAYWKQANVATPVYRAGRTFTSVQHNGSGIAQPLTTPAYTGSINGYLNNSVNPQSASLNSNWVDFTTQVTAMDESGSTAASSPWVYIHTTSCTTGTPTTTPNAVRLRQTSRNGSPFIEVAVPAYIPPGGNVLPAPVSPY